MSLEYLTVPGNKEVPKKDVYVGKDVKVTLKELPVAKPRTFWVTK